MAPGLVSGRYICATEPDIPVLRVAIAAAIAVVSFTEASMMMLPNANRDGRHTNLQAQHCLNFARVFAGVVEKIRGPGTPTFLVDERYTTDVSQTQFKKKLGASWLSGRSGMGRPLCEYTRSFFLCFLSFCVCRCARWKLCVSYITTLACRRRI